MTLVRIPGSKSVMARALFLAAAADGTTILRHPLWSDDTEAFAQGLREMGYAVHQSPELWTIEGQGPPTTTADVFCRDAATASRFMPALAAAGHGTFRFDASPQMRRRPVGPLTAALRALGVRLRHEEADGHLPLTIEANGIEGGDLTLDAGLSSQFLSALLLVGPLTRRGLRITVTDLVSVPYAEITLAMMRRFGITVTSEDGGTSFVVPPGIYRATDYLVEPDASSASYFFAAAAVTGRTVTVPGLSRDSLQGDLRFVDVLERMGAAVQITPESVTVTGPERLSGVTVNMRDISDTVPTLAAIAPFADGPVRIEDVYNTRVKECDRLAACEENLQRLGIRAKTGRDWLEIQPGTPVGAEIACHGDHRIAMAFSVTGLRTEGVNLDDPGCVKKTFPTFHETLAAWRTA